MLTHETIQGAKNYIRSHNGMYSLQNCGSRLQKNPLNAIELKIFMATLWAFYKETPSGILALALRVSDYWRDIDPWQANAKAAHILYAGFEEFGLQALGKRILPTHHQLFMLSASHFGVRKNDLNSQDYILKAGTDLGEYSKFGYRERSIPFALGFHLASELTSWWEFKYFYEGFMKFKKEYKISNVDPAMQFFHVHTLIEPEHLVQSENILNEFIKVDTNAWIEIYKGIDNYMSLYDALFQALNHKLKTKI